MNGKRNPARRGRPPVRRRRTRRRWGLLPWLAAALLALVVWVVLANHVLIIRTIRVSGNGSVPETDVIHLSGIHLGSRMRSISPDEIRRDVEADGRLAFVSVEKRYPGTVLLNVRERSRDALILQAGKILLLDSDGYVVAVSDQLPAQSVPYVTGLKPSTYQLGRQLNVADGRLNAMKAVVETLKAQGATGYVTELSVENTADLRLVTRTGMTVLLGDASNMTNKIIWMVGALKDLEARGEYIGRLDVSSGTKADFLPEVTPTPTPGPTPLPEATPEIPVEGEDGTGTAENEV